jgi:hypothetical protein
MLDDTLRFDALFHAFACASIGYAFALILHVQIGASAFGKCAFSAGYELHHGFVYGRPKGLRVGAIDSPAWTHGMAWR